MSTAKKVSIVGPGFTGWNVLELLVREGNTGTELVPRDEHAKHVEKSGASALKSDLDDHDLIVKHVPEHEVPSTIGSSAPTRSRDNLGGRRTPSQPSLPCRPCSVASNNAPPPPSPQSSSTPPAHSSSTTPRGIRARKIGRSCLARTWVRRAGSIAGVKQSDCASRDEKPARRICSLYCFSGLLPYRPRASVCYCTPIVLSSSLFYNTLTKVCVQCYPRSSEAAVNRILS
jgi:hypothetical protein